MSFYEKVRYLCEQKGFSISNIGERIPDLNVTRGSVSGWKRGATPRYAKLEQIASYFGVPVEYLTDDNFDLSDINAKRGKNGAASGGASSSSLSSSFLRALPLYESVSAGFGAYADSSVIDYIPCYIVNDTEAAETICIRVVGDSMYPKIENGDIIQVHKQESVDSGAIAVLMIDGEDAVVKRVIFNRDMVELQSINPLYPPRRFYGKDMNSIRVVGLVKSVQKQL